MFKTPSYEWNSTHKTFGIQVRAFRKGLDETYPEFGWCLYVLIYDNHPLFDKPELFVEGLDFHGGCTYDEKYTRTPARGIRYDWQKDSSYLKIGCDYQHYMDNFDHFNPSQGIPFEIEHDAKHLVEQMSEFSK